MGGVGGVYYICPSLPIVNKYKEEPVGIRVKEMGDLELFSHDSEGVIGGGLTHEPSILSVREVVKSSFSDVISFAFFDFVLLAYSHELLHEVF